jgi:phosphoribosylanthranilate isomerase
MSNPEKRHATVQIKICGLTDPVQARACARLGADAVGLIFYPPSARHVEKNQARRITAGLHAGTVAVGVFVDTSFDEIMHTVDRCGLTAVQLHGRETPQLVADLKKAGLQVIKALFTGRSPGFAAAADYDADAFLVECGRGPLPGGNAVAWDWSAAARLARRFPLVLAGGLAPGNIAAAIAAARPHAVDVSSGVEIRPGVKDLHRVRTLIEATRACSLPLRKRIIFMGKEHEAT